MSKTIGETLKNFADKVSGRNTQQVFERMPKPEVKKREKIDFYKLFDEHSFMQCGEYKSNQIIETLKKYFMGVKDFDTHNIVKNGASNKKGLLVYGDYGVGKTMFFKIIREMGKELSFTHNYNGLYFSQTSAPFLVEEYMQSTKKTYNGNFDINRYYKGRLYIDDLGAERKAFNDVELLDSILFERHRNNALTFITSNYTPSQIMQRYGARIGDRLPEMFNIIKWEGESFRE